MAAERDVTSGTRQESACNGCVGMMHERRTRNDTKHDMTRGDNARCHRKGRYKAYNINRV